MRAPVLWLLVCGLVIRIMLGHGLSALRLLAANHVPLHQFDAGYTVLYHHLSIVFNNRGGSKLGNTMVYGPVFMCQWLYSV